MLTLRRVGDFDESDDGFEASVVDVPLGSQVPTFDGDHHPVQNLLARRFADRPGVRTVAGHVG